jgi:hypothetical protein
LEATWQKNLKMHIAEVRLTQDEFESLMMISEVTSAESTRNCGNVITSCRGAVTLEASAGGVKGNVF